MTAHLPLMYQEWSTSQANQLTANERKQYYCWYGVWAVQRNEGKVDVSISDQH